MKKPTSKAKKTTSTRRKPATSKPAAAAVPTPPEAEMSEPQEVTHTPSETVSEPVIVKSVPPVLGAASLRKKDLIHAVCAKSGMKKKDVKPVIEAALEVLGEALAKDQELNLPPFAKLKIQKVKHLSNARVTVARLRQNVAKTSD